MKTLLLVTASARHEGSASRAAAERFISGLRAKHPGLRVVERDLAARTPAHLTTEWAGAHHTPSDKRTAAQRALLADSDTFLSELREAEAVVIATAMYNFAIPSPLKAWIDAIARSGEAFVYDAASGGFKGLLGGKRAVIIVASAGDYAPGTPAASADFATPYLRFILQFVGITDIASVAVPNQAGDQRAAALEAAWTRLGELARGWSA